jgi:hypothetical protein
MSYSLVYTWPTRPGADWYVETYVGNVHLWLESDGRADARDHNGAWRGTIDRLPEHILAELVQRGVIRAK